MDGNESHMKTEDGSRIVMSTAVLTLERLSIVCNGH